MKKGPEFPSRSGILEIHAYAFVYSSASQTGACEAVVGLVAFDIRMVSGGQLEVVEDDQQPVEV